MGCTAGCADLRRELYECRAWGEARHPWNVPHLDNGFAAALGHLTLPRTPQKSDNRAESHERDERHEAQYDGFSSHNASTIRRAAPPVALLRTVTRGPRRGGRAGLFALAIVSVVSETSEASKPAAAIQFRSDVTVELVRSNASDADVLFAARVSTQGEQSLAAAQDENLDTSRSKGLINYLMRDRHGSPFEHNSLTFYVQAPIFVFREFMRHRIASYNEESGRYRELNAVFYVPGPDRNLVQVGKPGAYEFHPGSAEQTRLAVAEAERIATEAYASYQRMLEAGIAREVARIVLPLSIYSSMYVTVNARSLMNFLSLRTKREGSHFPSYPQREIEMCAEKMEEHFATLMPLTYEAFNENGRVAP